MGYTTDFEGRINFDRPLTKEHAAYLKQFSETRRMRRDSGVAMIMPDPIRLAVGLPIDRDRGRLLRRRHWHVRAGSRHEHRGLQRSASRSARPLVLVGSDGGRHRNGTGRRSSTTTSNGWST